MSKKYNNDGILSPPFEMFGTDYTHNKLYKINDEIYVNIDQIVSVHIVALYDKRDESDRYAVNFNLNTGDSFTSNQFSFKYQAEEELTFIINKLKEYGVIYV